MKKVLFVCAANTCRSPMAQAIFGTLAEDEGRPFRAESAATEALEGTAIAENARWGDASGTTSSQGRARRRVKDTLMD